MSYCCSQCDFTACFESALLMHHQLHHEGPGLEDGIQLRSLVNERPTTLPRMASLETASTSRDSKGYKLNTRSSATRLFDKLKSKICRGRPPLFIHPEEGDSCDVKNGYIVPSECTSKGLKYKSESSMLCARAGEGESYGCHLCPFIADRITMLDRHLLNDHQIGLDNLLKLVMAKTKDGLQDKPKIHSQPYYSVQDDSEYVVTTTTPRVKVLKNTGTNTENEVEISRVDFSKITNEMELLMKDPLEKCNKNELFDKMRVLNECMCKLVESSYSLKKLGGYKSKHSVREHRSNDERRFDLGLGDQDTPRNWEKSLSDDLERRPEASTKYKTDNFYY